MCEIKLSILLSYELNFYPVLSNTEQKFTPNDGWLDNVEIINSFQSFSSFKSNVEDIIEEPLLPIYLDEKWGDVWS